jgi:hypothetical protein
MTVFHDLFDDFRALKQILPPFFLLNSHAERKGVLQVVLNLRQLPWG